MIRPRRAILLAAGFGSRLSPLTLDCPKPLIPVRGKLLIGRLFEQLQSWGVREILVNVHHRADRMIEELPGLCPSNLQLSVSHEPDILGTGGGLRRMAWFWDDSPLWICNADVMQTLDPLPLLREMDRHHPLACLWMVPDHGPRTVRVEDGLVRSFTGGGMTFSGLHLARRTLLDYLPEEERFCSVIPAYEAAMRDGLEVRGVTVPGSVWEDAGTPERLLAANGGSLVFPGAEVAEDTRLEQALVGPGAKLREGRIASGLVLSPKRGISEEEHRLLPDAEAVEELPARGSDRSFARIHLPDRTVMRVRTGTSRPENTHTADHFRFLAGKGIRVPDILHAAPGGSLLLLEDGGREHLLDRLKTGSPERNREDMARALALTAHLHGLTIPETMSLEPPFSSVLYRWEHELFELEFLARHDPGVAVPPLHGALQEVANELDRQPEVLVHRDLQSTNFLWTDGGPMLIDVQGMRLGPAAYDLASLLADPYVDRDPKEQLRLLEHYNRLAGSAISRNVYALGATQRLVQALGAYGRLGARPATRRFLHFVPAAVRQLSVWAPEGPLKQWAGTFFVRHPEEIAL